MVPGCAKGCSGFDIIASRAMEINNLFAVNVIPDLGECQSSTVKISLGQDFVGTIHKPAIFGVTKKQNLVFWESLHRLEFRPTVISKLPELLLFYSAVAGDQCIYFMDRKICYLYGLEDAVREWKKLLGVNFDHGHRPPIDILDGKLYACGMGEAIDGISSKKCEVFFSGQWSEIADMNNSRSRHCIVALKGFLYCIGGVIENGHLLCSVERYDPSNNVWKIIQPLNEARCDAKAVVYKSRIYVLGGHSAWSSNLALECFDPDTSIWTLSVSDWWRNNSHSYPFVFDNKVLCVSRKIIQQLPFNDEAEDDLMKVELWEELDLAMIFAWE